MNIEDLNRLCQGTLIDGLGIRFTAFSDTTVEAVMPVTPKLFQPLGVVHGGALLALAETVGSAGSFLMVDPDHYTVLGSVIHSQHIAPARDGILHAVATLRVKGDFKHIWDVEIKEERGKLISISRVTNSIKPRKEEV